MAVKVIIKIGKVIVLGIIGIMLLAVVTEGILGWFDKRELDPPGTLVEVGGNLMQIYAAGSGEEKIVLIPGGGVHAPYVDFQPIWSRLADEKRVIVIERFGYGFSDVTNRERTLKNIVEEMREALHKSGESPPYTLAGHSLGGLIAIAYSQNFPDEVNNIIMLDSRVPEAYLEQDLAGESMNLAIASALKYLGLVRLTHMQSVYELGEMNGYREVPKELWDIDRMLYSS